MPRRHQLPFVVARDRCTAEVPHAGIDERRAVVVGPDVRGGAVVAANGKSLRLERIDVTGTGAGVADVLRRANGISLVEIDAAASSTVEGFARMRDQVWGSLKEWLRKGGSIPRDARTVSDLCAPKYGFDVRGQLKVESKIEMRKRLGRSTDRADALALAVFADADREWDPVIVPGSYRRR